MSAANSLVSCMSATTSSISISRSRSQGICMCSPWTPKPALLTSTSTASPASRIRRCSAAAASRAPRSAAMTCTSTCVFDSISALRARSLSSRRATRIRWQPRRASSRANSAPRPEEAPVTSAVLPRRMDSRMAVLGLVGEAHQKGPQGVQQGLLQVHPEERHVLLFQYLAHHLGGLRHVLETDDQRIDLHEQLRPLAGFQERQVPLHERAGLQHPLPEPTLEALGGDVIHVLLQHRVQDGDEAEQRLALAQGRAHERNETSDAGLAARRLELPVHLVQPAIELFGVDGEEHLLLALEVE